jgi:hypothetical protein
MQDINTHEFPNGGWQFRQPQTGWAAPTPIGSTHDQTVILIIKHRLMNPAIVGRHKLSTDPKVVSEELLNFNRIRLGIPKPEAHPPSFFGPSSSSLAGAAGNIKRAAQGTSVWLEWLAHGGIPEPQPLAEKRAETCVNCQRNEPGAWYTVAPASLLAEAIETWKKATGRDFKFETAQGDKLKSCGVCLCLSKIKVFVPLELIEKRTKPEILAEFPPNCWIARKDQ